MSNMKFLLEVIAGMIIAVIVLFAVYVKIGEISSGKK